LFSLLLSAKWSAMFNALSKYSDLGLLAGRVGLGVMYVLHGWPTLAAGQAAWEKYGHAMASIGIAFFPKFWGLAAGLSELAGGILLILGLLYRPACFFIGITMFVGFMSILRSGHGFNDFSRPLEMTFVFLIFLFVGPGKYSFDKG
jgi:putative oxidoreductase